MPAAQDSDDEPPGSDPIRPEDAPVSLPRIPMSSLATPDLDEGTGELASLTAAWEAGVDAPLGGYSEEDE